MPRATAAVIADRVDTLQRMLLEGSSNSACVAHASREWGVSRRQAYRLLKRAWQRIAEDVDATDVSRRELVAWSIAQLMDAAGTAKAQRNPGATIGIIRALDGLVGLSPHSNALGQRWR